MILAKTAQSETALTLDLPIGMGEGNFSTSAAA